MTPSTKLTLVMPCYTLNSDLEEMAEWGLESYIGQVDEIIVVEDGGQYSPKLRHLADKYIYLKENVGFTKAVNTGWRLSDGDFTAIVNSDTDLLAGNLRDLCIEGKVVCPKTENVDVPLLAGHFFVVPRPIQEQYGMLDERLRMYVSDSAYEGRIKHLIQQVPSVVIWHENQATTRVAGIGEKERDEDRKTYENINNNT